MLIKEFFEADSRNQTLMFHALKNEIKTIIKKVLWVEFKKNDATMTDECLSFLFEKLIGCYKQIERGKERSFIYTTSKRFFLELFFEKNVKTVFVKDILIYQKGEMKENDFNDMKIETVDNLKTILKSVTDKNSLLVVSALIELIINNNDYNAQYASLYLYRKTDLSFGVVYRILKQLNIKLPLSTHKYFENIFMQYGSMERQPPLTDETSLITDWEKRAIERFENHHEQTRGENFESRHFRPAVKRMTKSTPQERVHWFLNNINNRNLEKEYYEKFNMSYQTFKADKRNANK